LPRPCSICTHKQRAEIEEAILREEPYRSIKECFGVSDGAIARHKNGCMKAAVEAGRAAEVLASASEIQDRVKKIADDLHNISEEARGKDKYGPAVSAKRAELDALKMLAPQGGEASRPDDGLIAALRGVAEVLDWGEEGDDVGS